MAPTGTCMVDPASIGGGCKNTRNKRVQGSAWLFRPLLGHFNDPEKKGFLIFPCLAEGFEFMCSFSRIVFSGT